jgi:hypothetical protein
MGRITLKGTVGKQRECDGVDWCRIGCCEHDNEPSGSIKAGNFLSAEQLSTFQERSWTLELDAFHGLGFLSRVGSLPFALSIRFESWLGTDCSHMLLKNQPRTNEACFTFDFSILIDVEEYFENILLSTVAGNLKS